MAEDVRKIAELAPRPRIIFLGKQANIVTKLEQPLEHLAGFVVSAHQREVIGKPKTARKESTFSRW